MVTLRSPSSRRAWIEIPHRNFTSLAKKVALLAEGVDRNRYRAGGLSRFAGVALLAEGVDRNDEVALMPQSFVKSPSSRRAWIEIPILDGILF